MLRALLLLLMTITPSGQPTQKQPSDYTPAANSRVVSWQLKRIPPPSPLYVSVDDNLVASAATSQTNEVVTVNYRLLRASDGVIMPGQFTVAPPSNRSITVQSQALAEGFLLSASVRAAVATTRGQTFVRAFLGAGPFGAGQPSYMLMADYATTAMAPAHPNGRVLSPTEGPGWLRTGSAAQPAAGANWFLGPPANARWRVQTFQAGYQTSAAAGNRIVNLQIQQILSAVAYYGAQNVTQAPGLNVFYSGSAGQPIPAPPPGIINLPFPAGLILSSVDGDLITPVVAFQDTADQWTKPFALIEEWFENV
jgi:hypothetical protein